MAVTVLVVDPQLQHPWNAEVAWGLEDDVVRTRGTWTDAHKGVFEGREARGDMLVEGGGVMR